MKIERLTLGTSLFEENERIAGENRRLLKEKKIASFNLMGGPGTGKTAILEKTLQHLQKKLACAVIEGDIAGALDSKRLQKYRIPIIQINTGGACHLDAGMIRKALRKLPLDEIRVLFVENVGNLVCPAEFDLGLEKNVVVSCTTEGEDKPAKYPLMFKTSQVCLLNKMDLAEALRFDRRKFERHVRRVNRKLKIIPVSGRTGENLKIWIDYLKSCHPGG